MTYVTQAQLSDRYGDLMLIALTDRGPAPFGVVDTAVVARALADTDAMIDGYLARRYALPLSVAQPMLVDIGGAIAIWKLHTYAPDPKIEADYKDAMRVLRDIASGTITLTAAGVEAPSTGSTGVQMTDRDRPFTEDNLKGYI